MRALGAPMFAIMAAAAAPADERPRSVTTIGIAEALAPPDSLAIEISVAADRPSAGDAASVQAGLLASVLDALKASGVAAQDVATVGPTLSPLGKSAPLPDIEGGAYRARSILNVQVRDLRKATDLVRLAESRGAQIRAYHYDLANRDAREDALRVAAVENARRRAELYAKAAGMKVGAAQTIVEQGASDYESANADLPSMVRERENSEADSLAAGGVTLSVTVYVTFDLEPK